MMDINRKIVLHWDVGAINRSVFVIASIGLLTCFVVILFGITNHQTSSSNFVWLLMLVLILLPILFKLYKLIRQKAELAAIVATPKGLSFHKSLRIPRLTWNRIEQVQYTQTTTLGHGYFKKRNLPCFVISYRDDKEVLKTAAINNIDLTGQSASALAAELKGRGKFYQLLGGGRYDPSYW